MTYLLGTSLLQRDSLDVRLQTDRLSRSLQSSKVEARSVETRCITLVSLLHLVVDPNARILFAVSLHEDSLAILLMSRKVGYEA